MGIKIIDPILLDATNKLLKDHALKIITELPELNLDLEKVNILVSNIIKLLNDNSTAFTGKAFIVKINFISTASSPNPISFDNINNALSSGFKIIEIDINSNIINYYEFKDFTYPGIAKLSQSFNDGCIFHIRNGREFHVISKGMIIDDINALSPGNIPSVDKQTALNARDYKESLKLFYQKRIRYAQHSSHWSDRAKRLLVSGKTEEVFQKNLYNWLEENTTGGKIAFEVGKITSDRTDIEIKLLESSDFYIIEVKWLGTNDKKNSLDIPRLKEGINQVNNYLDRDADVSEVCLVVYDGRNINAFEALECLSEEDNQWKQIDECEDEIFNSKGTGYVFFLENESASKRKK